MYDVLLNNGQWLTFIFYDNIRTIKNSKKNSKVHFPILHIVFFTWLILFVKEKRWKKLKWKMI